MIRHGWVYLTRAQDKGLFDHRVAIKAWLDRRGMFMAESYGFVLDPRYMSKKITIRAVDARDDFDADAALFEFKMAWL